MFAKNKQQKTNTQINKTTTTEKQKNTPCRNKFASQKVSQHISKGV